VDKQTNKQTNKQTHENSECSILFSQNPENSRILEHVPNFKL